MNFKWFFLFFLLGFPVGVYLFLQGFGENKFEVPIYYENGIDDPKGNCPSIFEPFSVPDISEYDSTIKKTFEGVTIIDIGTPNCDSCQFKINNLISITDKFRNWEELKIYSIVVEMETGVYPTSNKDWKIFTSSNEAMVQYANCALNLDLVHSQGNLMVKNGVVVLIDAERRIRGYYNIFNRKESDRLAVELEILRKNN